MSDKVVSLGAWRNRQQLPGVAPVAKQKPGSDVSLMRNLVNSMAGAVSKAEGEDSTASLLMLSMGIEMSLENLHAPKNSTKVQEAKELADTYSDQTLLALMRDATDQQLSTKPHFFRGLVASARGRSLSGERGNTPKE